MEKKSLPKDLQEYLTQAAVTIEAGRDMREGNPLWRQIQESRGPLKHLRHPLELITGGIEGAATGYLNSLPQFPESRQAWFDARGGMPQNRLLRTGMDAWRVMQDIGYGAMGESPGGYAQGVPQGPVNGNALRRMGR